VLITLPSYKKTCEKRQIKPAKKKRPKKAPKILRRQNKKTLTKEEVGLKKSNFIHPYDPNKNI